MIKRILMAVLPVVLLAAGAIGALTMISNRPAPDTRSPDVAAPAVRTITADAGTFPLTISAEGTVQPRTEAQLVPEVAGRVVEISPSLAVGGFFEEGEVLLRIDPREYELAVIRARAAVAQAQLRLAIESEEARVATQEWELLGDGQPSALALRQPQIAEAEAALASARAAQAQVEYDLERTVIRAPFAGRIREKRVDIGQYVQRGAALASIYAVDAAEIRLPISDSELAYVNLPMAYRGDGAGETRNGPPVTIRADFAGRTYEWKGRIVGTDAVIDPQTRMVHAIARVEDPYGRDGTGSRPPLAVGMFVRAEIQGRSSGKVVALPRNVVRPDGTVMVVDPYNRLEFRTIDIYRAEPGRILVRSGIEPGDRVVVSTLEAAVNGMRVRIEEEQD